MKNSIEEDVVTAAWTVAHHSAIKGIRIYALVNNAASTQMLDFLQRWRPTRWNSLFEGSLEEDAITAAPLLIEIGHLSLAPNQLQKTLLFQIHNNLLFSNALIFLHSPLSFDEIAHALRARLSGRLAGRLDVLIRFFDTRIFSSLMIVFDEMQRKAFLSLAEKWLWLDRFGQWQSINTIFNNGIEYKSPCIFTQSQEDALLKLAEPDSIARILKTFAPDLCSRYKFGDLNLLIIRCLEAAKNFEIIDIRELALFCMIEMESGPKFYASSAWDIALNDMHIKNIKLAEVYALVMDKPLNN